jgi:hypothetical protein
MVATILSLKQMRPVTLCPYDFVKQQRYVHVSTSSRVFSWQLSQL